MLNRVHGAVAVLFVAMIVIQVFLAGAALSSLGGSGDFGTHIEFGYTWVGIAALVLVVTALVARRPRRDVAISVGILVLYIVQTILPSLKTSAPTIAALHPVNAMVLFGLACWYAVRAWRTGH